MYICRYRETAVEQASLRHYTRTPDTRTHVTRGHQDTRTPGHLDTRITFRPTHRTQTIDVISILVNRLRLPRGSARLGFGEEAIKAYRLIF